VLAPWQFQSGRVELLPEALTGEALDQLARMSCCGADLDGACFCRKGENAESETFRGTTADIVFDPLAYRRAAPPFQLLPSNVMLQTSSHLTPLDSTLPVTWYSLPL